MEAARLDHHIQMFIKVINLKETVLGLSGEIYGDLMVLEDQILLDQPGTHEKSMKNMSGQNSGLQMRLYTSTRQ